MPLTVSIPSHEQIDGVVHYKILVNGLQEQYELAKRYSSFVSFIEAAEREIDEKVPVSLPSKKWFKNAESIEKRRIDLEVALRALLRVRGFAESLAVRDFFEVSKHTPSSQTSSIKDWVHSVSMLSRLLGQAREERAGSNAQRKACIDAKAAISRLRQETKHEKDNQIGSGEAARRQNQLDEYARQLAAVDAPASHHVPTGSACGQGRVLGETSETREHDNTGLLLRQKELMEEQDKRVEALRVAIGRQRELGVAINDEVTLQTQMLHELDDEVGRVNSKLNRAKRGTGKLL